MREMSSEEDLDDFVQGIELDRNQIGEFVDEEDLNKVEIQLLDQGGEMAMIEFMKGFGVSECGDIVEWNSIEAA